jgi:uncharacterized lipoprotein YehR (DUF1307 family)
MEINIEKEVADLIEKIDDAIEQATEEFSINFTERHMNDWVNTLGLSANTTQMFSAIEEQIHRRALQKIRIRWAESGN